MNYKKIFKLPLIIMLGIGALIMFLIDGIVIAIKKFRKEKRKNKK